MKKLNVSQLDISNISEMFVSEIGDDKNTCGDCKRKVKYTFQHTSGLLCAKCCIKLGANQSQIDKLYNFAYFKPKLGKEKIQSSKKKKHEDNSILVELYTDGWLKGNMDSVNSFIDRFKPLIFKHSKYVSREHSFDDLVQYFKERILYYHKKELEKGSAAKFDYSKPENVGALIRATKEFVLQGVNLITSRKLAANRKGDYEAYVEIDSCFSLASNSISVERKVHEKMLTEEIHDHCCRHLSDTAFDVYSIQKSGMFKNNEIQERLEISKEELSSAKKEIKDLWRSPIFEQFRLAFVS